MKQVTNINEKTQFFASEELLTELKNKMKAGDCIVNFAYTDYGGDFFDKVCVAFFSEKHPENIVKENTVYSGENAFIFGEVAKEFIEESENYLLGYEDIEEHYTNMEQNEEYEGFKYFIESLNTDKYEIQEDAIEKLCNNKGGYYSITTQGLDYSESDLIEYCINEGIITEIVNA